MIYLVNLVDRTFYEETQKSKLEVLSSTTIMRFVHFPKGIVTEKKLLDKFIPTEVLFY